MRLLIDTHTVIWAQNDPGKLGPEAFMVLQDPANQLLLSAGTIWELSIKCGLGKLTLTMPFRPWVDKAIEDLGLLVLPIKVGHAEIQGTLPWHHRDPFDRLLTAQSLVEEVPLISADLIFDRYGIPRIW